MAKKKEALRKFKVQLKSRDCPALEVEASDRWEAVEKYKQHCGILGTIHGFDVDDEEVPGDES